MDGPGGRAAPPSPAELDRLSDRQLQDVRAIVGRLGDRRAVYTVFMRHAVIFAPRLALEWLRAAADARGIKIDIDLPHPEGAWVGAGEPLMYLSGSLKDIVDLETVYLPKLGPACAAAFNAYSMCCDLPNAAFVASDARYVPGGEMAEAMAYGASIGSAAARRDAGAKGFIGSIIDATAPWYGQVTGMSTMASVLVAYAGSTVRAAELLHEAHPDDELTVMVDYFGREVADALAVCRRFPDLAADGKLLIRIALHAGRYIEGLDRQRSAAVVERHAPAALRACRNDQDLNHLVGPGVSAAALWLLRTSLDEAGFNRVRIVASAGIRPAKCRMLAAARAPLDMVVTSAFLPEYWVDTNAVAELLSLDGVPTVRYGREYLLGQR